MLVDDEPLITKGLKAIIDWEDYGFEVVHIAENGEEALLYLKENHIDLLVTDIMMPKISGLELIKRAKAGQVNLKCIILSGYQEFDYVKQGMRLGIENYLLKPVDEEELIRTIQGVSQKLYTDLEDRHNPEFNTLKDNTLWRLLIGEIGKGDWQERLALYDMDLEKPRYGVSILHFVRCNDLKLSKRVRNHIEMNFAATCLYNPDQELMIIFEVENGAELIQANNELKIYLDSVHHESGDYYISMGDAVSLMEDLEVSYLTARDLSLFQIALKPNQIISDDLNIDKQHLLKVQLEHKNDLAKSVLKSKDDVIDGIESYYESFYEVSSFVSHIVFRKYTIDLISYIHHSAQVDKYYSHTTAIERLMYATDIPQIGTILYDYCDDLLKIIQNKDTTRSPIIQDVLEYMHANYHEELSLKTLSQRFFVNPIYLGQLFQKELGMVFSEYINHYRLEKAKELLKSTHKRAGDIGKLVGYADTTYFYKQFKRHVGATPTEWRNM